MTNLPNRFLILSGEGLARAEIYLEPIQNLDSILSKFGSEKIVFLRKVADSPYGLMHIITWAGERTRSIYVLELFRGKMAVNCNYETITKDGFRPWISPAFIASSKEVFPLRCGFDFAVWAEAGLRTFLGLSPDNGSLYLWVFYKGQIYRPPMGNIFEGTCQFCLGANPAEHQAIFRQPCLSGLHMGIELLSNSPWNSDTFLSREKEYPSQLIRFDAAQSDLPMLPPLNPEIIAKCSVCTNKDLVQFTGLLNL